MRHFARVLSIAALLAAAVAFAGCDSTCAAVSPAAPVAARPAAPCYEPAPAAAAPCYQPQPAGVQLVQAPQYVSLGAPVGIESRVGAPEVARAGLAIPGNLIVCGSTALAKVGVVAGEFLVCVGNTLVPTPTPSVRYVYAPPPGWTQFPPQAPAAPRAPNCP